MKPRVLWTIWPSNRDPVTARFVAPWPAIIEARGQGRLELAGYDGRFYTGPIAVCPARGWTFRTRAAAQRAHAKLSRNNFDQPTPVENQKPQ